MWTAEAEAAQGAGPSSNGHPPSARSPPSHSGDAARWVRGLVSAHFQFIWRSLRRLGVPEAEVDDAAQKVFWVALRRVNEVAEGSERAFLFSTAMHVAADVRRARARGREVLDEEALERAPHPISNPEELAEQKRAREMLDDVLDAMDSDLRAVFVLFELEELTAVEIADLLGLPLGTVASRLRRGREVFRNIVKRLRTKWSNGVRSPNALGPPRR